MKIHLNEIVDECLTKEELIQKLTTFGSTIEIVIEYQHIGSTQSYLDIIEDHLTTAYSVEKLAKTGKIKKITSDWSVFRPKIILKLTKIDFKTLAKEILNIAPLFAGEPDDFDLLNALEDLDTFTESLPQTTFQFPEIIDDYYANLVNGAYYEMASEYCGEGSEKKYLSRFYKKYPEHKYGYWRSAASNSIGEDFYVSTEGWIVPKTSNLEKILITYSGLDHQLTFDDAEILDNSGDQFIMNFSYAIKKDRRKLDSFYFCSRMALSKKLKIDTSKIEYPFKFKISEFASILIAENSFFHYIWFYPRKLDYDELKSLISNVNPVYDRLKSLIGLKSDIQCNWNELNDEKFEQLCYDVIYFSEKFDSSTIKKMGKSRSRDGGRDIEVYTKKIIGQNVKKYIFQCKFLSPGTSLGSSKLTSASNTIIQYSANGYGIFTTGIIDSTLYDLMDSFSHNLNIEVESWSVYELERYLARMPEIKKRYFASLSPDQ